MDFETIRDKVKKLLLGIKNEKISPSELCNSLKSICKNLKADEIYTILDKLQYISLENNSKSRNFELLQKAKNIGIEKKYNHCSYVKIPIERILENRMFIEALAEKIYSKNIKIREYYNDDEEKNYILLFDFEKCNEHNEYYIDNRNEILKEQTEKIINDKICKIYKNKENNKIVYLQLFTSTCFKITVSRKNFIEATTNEKKFYITNSFNRKNLHIKKIATDVFIGIDTNNLFFLYDKNLKHNVEYDTYKIVESYLYFIIPYFISLNLKYDLSKIENLEKITKQDSNEEKDELQNLLQKQINIFNQLLKYNIKYNNLTSMYIANFTQNLSLVHLQNTNNYISQNINIVTLLEYKKKDEYRNKKKEEYEKKEKEKRKLHDNITMFAGIVTMLTCISIFSDLKGLDNGFPPKISWYFPLWVIFLTVAVSAIILLFKIAEEWFKEKKDKNSKDE